jgi:hypothetical protein
MRNALRLIVIAGVVTAVIFAILTYGILLDIGYVSETEAWQIPLLFGCCMSASAACCLTNHEDLKIIVFKVLPPLKLSILVSLIEALLLILLFIIRLVGALLYISTLIGFGVIIMDIYWRIAYGIVAIAFGFRGILFFFGAADSLFPQPVDYSTWALSALNDEANRLEQRENSLDVRIRELRDLQRGRLSEHKARKYGRYNHKDEIEYEKRDLERERGSIRGTLKEIYRSIYGTHPSGGEGLTNKKKR